MHYLHRRKSGVFAGLLLACALTACRTDPKMTQFREDMDTFCTSIATIDDAINAIDPEAENASELALSYLDQLDQTFQDFAQMDFPESYDYLEPVADEAGTYMQEAVKSYHLAYADNDYNAETAAYARENSARAFKRVQVIIDILHGNEPTAVSTSASP